MTACRTRAPLAATLATGLVLSACGGGDDDPEDGGDYPDSQARGAGSPVELSPLTGAPVGDDAPEHPILVVKIDNTVSSSPQAGLGDADLVVEELVEGGITRLAVMFWERTPADVGPVRSTRATDIGIVRPAEAVLVASGGAPQTIRRIASEDITVQQEGDTGFSRDASRSAPYDLMMNLDELAASLDPAPVPGPYLPFGPEESWPGGKAVDTVAATFSPAHTTTWRYEAGTGWVRPDSFAAQGDDFVPDNLLVVRVEVGDAGYRDPGGNPVPETNFYGEGDATLFHGGEAVEGHWSKDGKDGRLMLTTGGEELQVPVGTTWIELLPKGTGSLRY